jgi:hypothetical protein
MVLATSARGDAMAATTPCSGRYPIRSPMYGTAQSAAVSTNWSS